jgi:hypothetical protein
MRLIPLVALLTLSTATAAVDKVQSLKVKLGLWEVTTTVLANQDLPLPAGLLEKLTPEQRARVEERIKARSSDGPKITKRSYCLTEEQLNEGPTFGQKLKSCKRTALASSDKTVHIHLACFDNGMERDEIVQVEALASDRIKGFVNFSLAGADASPNSPASFSAIWIGPRCSSPR